MKNLARAAIAVLSGALLFPAVSQAATPRHEPTEAGCFGKARQKGLDNNAAKMAEGKVRAALDGYRTNGDEGCRKIVEWLEAGNPGGDDDHIEAVIPWIGRSDVEGAWEQVLKYAVSPNDEIRDEALEVLEERLVELTAVEMEPLITSEFDDVREAAVNILAGHYSKTEIVMTETAGGFGPTIPLPQEVEFYGATEMPAVHATGLARLVGDNSAEVREQVATVIGRMPFEGLGASSDYPDHLMALAGDANEDVFTAVAKATGLSCPPNGPALAEIIVGKGDDDLNEELVEAIEEVIDEKRYTEHTLALLEWLGANATNDIKGQCEKLAKKVAKKLK